MTIAVHPRTDSAADADVGFDLREFRSALGRFPTGVSVVTGRGPAGEAIGMTISSFTSLSLRPPLVLFSVDRRAYSLGALQQADGYCINVLSEGQQSVSQGFATALADKWGAVEHAPGFGGGRLLAGALAHFECRPHAQHDGGDHVIFVAEVVRFTTAVAPINPLIFFRGRYRALAAEAVG